MHLQDERNAQHRLFANPENSPPQLAMSACFVATCSSVLQWVENSPSEVAMGALCTFYDF